jgi:uncharacterized SAM-binding protein YcdF (DUF218 family)
MLWLQIKSVLKHLLLPPTGPLLLALIGIVLLKYRPLLARICLVLGVGSLWLLSTPIVADVFTGLAERYPPMDLRRAADAQAIVILGGGGQRAFAPEYGGPAAEPLLLERLNFGAFIAHKTGLPVLVTGYRIEAVAMHDTLLRNYGIDARWVDSKAYDTFDNARNSARLLNADGVHRIVLVTHGTHMWRSVHEFTDAGLEVIPAPVGILAEREIGVWRFVPNLDAMQRGFMATYELIGEPLRALLVATHLRRQ